MKNKLLKYVLTSVIGFALSGCNCGVSQEGVLKSSSSYNKHLLKSDSHHLLGSPVFSINGSKYIDPNNFTSCLQNISADTAVGPYGQAPTLKAEMALSVTQVTETLSNLLGGNLNINIDNAGSADIMAKIERNSNMSAHNLILYVSSTIVQPITFQDKVKFNNLTPDCGVGYVNVVNAAIDFKGIISIRFDDQYQKKAAEAQLTIAGINSLDSNARVKLNNILSKYHTEIDVSILQTGGDSHQIFEIFKLYQPKDGETIKLANVNVNNFNDLMNIFWIYGTETLKQQFISNLQQSTTLDNFKRHFILAYSDKIPAATVEYSSSTKPNYDAYPEVLKLLSDANTTHRKLVSELNNFTKYYNIMDSILYSNKSAYGKKKRDAVDAIDILQVRYRDTIKNLIKNDNIEQSQIDLSLDVIDAELALTALQATNYKNVYKITGSTTPSVYLLPYTKEGYPNSMFFLSYTPLEYMYSSAYTPYVNYELDFSTKILKWSEDPYHYPDSNPTLIFSLNNVYLDSNDKSLNYDSSSYYSNQNSTQKQFPSSDKQLRGMFGIIKLASF